MGDQEESDEIYYDHPHHPSGLDPDPGGDHSSSNGTTFLEDEDPEEWNCLYGHLFEQNGKEGGGGGHGDESGGGGIVVNLLWSATGGGKDKRDVSQFNSDDGGVIGGESDVGGGDGSVGGAEALGSWNFGGAHKQKSEFSLSNYSHPDGLENHNGSSGYCNRSWDELLCWPQTAEGTSVSLPCFTHFRGIAYDSNGTVTRRCLEGGIWQNKTDYSECIPKPQLTTETAGTVGTHDMYFAGYCLSLMALAIAMIIFLVFKELRCLRNTIHTHLIITYILADALWLITSIQSHLGQQTQVSCITFILLHYFHLTNFFWMFVEGLYLYVLVVQTFMAENVKFRVYASIGWGLPLLVVIAWSIAKWLTHPTTIISSETPKSESESEISSCFWLNVNLYDWIYKLPAIIVLAANSIFLLQIMWVLITKLRSATNPETQQSRKAAKALVVLMPLLGLTYVLFLRGSSQTPAYEITRALLLSTQGFLVALLYCFLNGEVRIALRHRWNRLRAMGPDLGCCDHRNVQQMRDWPRSRTESIRLYTPTQNTTPIHRKRGSSCASDTVTTCLGPQQQLQPPLVINTVNGSHTVQTVQTQQQQPLLVTATPSSRNLSTSVTTKTYDSTDNNALL